MFSDCTKADLAFGVSWVVLKRCLLGSAVSAPRRNLAPEDIEIPGDTPSGNQLNKEWRVRENYVTRIENLVSLDLSED